VTANVLFICFVIALALGYGTLAIGYPSMTLQEGYGPGLFPLVIAGFLVALGAAEMIRQVSMAQSRRGVQPTDSQPTAQPGEDKIGLSPAGRDTANILLLVASVVGAVSAIPYVGFVPATAPLVFVLAVLMGLRPVWVSAGVAIATSGIIYLVFSEAFGVIFAF